MLLPEFRADYCTHHVCTTGRRGYRYSVPLWNLASALALFGRYAEARVAGKDAIACLEAALYADAWLTGLGRGVRGWGVEPLQGELATWVSVSRGPSTRGSGSRGLLKDWEGPSKVTQGRARGADEGGHDAV
ncbi:hypothetical protein HGRIS_011848 [Hohenbuehelia grisea]|uniref:Uncharacterized protein n=1 Tax=Hohenbuehelia grisea TaxID=104357 RepID=A0ABR3JWC0_9AGAR